MQRTIQRVALSAKACRPGILGLTLKPRLSTYKSVAPLSFTGRQPVLSSLFCQSSFHTSSCQHENRSVMTNLGDAEDEVDPKDKIMIGFTCKVCDERSQHIMSKLSYTKGVVLIQCPKCENRHLIADNLGWFRDSKVNVEDIVKENGEEVTRVVVTKKE